MKLITELADSDVLIGRYNNLMVIDMAGLLQMKHLTRIGELRKRIEAAYRDRWLSLSFVRPSAGTPEAPVRQAAAKAMKEGEHRSRAVVTVMEAGGVAGMALRTILRTLNMLGGTGGKIVGSFDEAAALIVPLLDPAGETDATLRAAITDFRKQIH